MTIPYAPSGSSNVLLRSQTYNTIADSINGVRLFGSSQTQFGSVVVMMSNDSGTDVLRYNVVGIGDPIVVPGDNAFDDEYENNNMFKVVATDEDWVTESKPFGIAQEGMVSGTGVDAECGQVLVTGITSAVVNVLDTNHKFVTTGSTAFELETTDTPTSILLLYAPATGDDVICKVLLSAGGGPGEGDFEVKLGKTISDVEPGGIGDVRLFNATVSPPAQTAETQTDVHLDWLHSGQKISAGKEVGIMQFKPLNAAMASWQPDTAVVLDEEVSATDPNDGRLYNWISESDRTTGPDPPGFDATEKTFWTRLDLVSDPELWRFMWAECEDPPDIQIGDIPIF